MRADVTLATIVSSEDVDAAAVLALRAHAQLRVRLPWLPARVSADFAARIGWVTRHGVVVGMYAGRELTAFLGAFAVDDFRHAGPGSVGPEWCHGFAAGVDVAAACRQLYRHLAPALIARGCPIHAFSFYASAAPAVEAMGLTGFGRIAMDAACPTADLLQTLAAAGGPAAIRRATADDAAALAALDVQLAAHLSAAPVLMPRPRGRDAAQWREWLADPQRVAVAAWHEGEAVGFIKAERPQPDVSYAAHGDATLAINGMCVAAGSRRLGLGAALLAQLAHWAAAAGRTLVSVDCETTNLEAYGFWSRWFRPVSWSLERRV
jgi:GNAT superfamily N-acetyltransferase